MNASIYRISLDVHDTQSSVSLDVKRGDTNRKLYISLMDGGFPYHISEESYAVFTAKKPDENIVFNPCTIEGCTIIYELTPQTVAVEGVVECEIRLYDADDKLLTGPSFLLVVHETVYNEGDMVESETEVEALTHLISEATTALNESKNVNQESRDVLADLEAKQEDLNQKVADAEGSASRAKASEDAALESENAAASSANQAGIHALDANAFATAAEESMNSAATHEANASNYEKTVGQAAAAAGQSAADARESAEQSWHNAAEAVTAARDTEAAKEEAVAAAAGAKESENNAAESETIAGEAALRAEAAAETAAASAERVVGYEDDIARLIAEVADLKYVPIEITSISNTVGTVEKGRVITSVTVNWQRNKDAVSQTVDGKAVSADAVGYAMGFDGFTTNKTITVTATDERGTVATAETRVTFLNGVYYGVLEDGVEINSAAILGLVKSIQSGRSVKFTAEVGSGARIAYAIPASGYGNPVFMDYNTKYGVDMYLAAEKLAFTNVHGYTTEYNVWLSTEIQKNNITVSVS